MRVRTRLHTPEQTVKDRPSSPQDDCKVFYNPVMVSLSNHRWLECASFDKLRMSRHQRAASLCNRPAFYYPLGRLHEYAGEDEINLVAITAAALIAAP